MSRSDTAKGCVVAECIDLVDRDRSSSKRARAWQHDYATDTHTCVISSTNQIYNLKNGSGIKKRAGYLTSVSERL